VSFRVFRLFRRRGFVSGEKVAAMQICGHGGNLSVHGGVRNAAHVGASCESLLCYCALPMVDSGFLVWSEVGNTCATGWLAGITGAQHWVPLNH